jgi:cell wall assembly regulator SMI1
VKTLWDRLHTWLRANAPVVLASLQRGASPEQIAAAEAALGVTLPDDFKAAYRIHDGQKEGRRDWPPGFLEGMWWWYRLQDVVADWRSWVDLLNKGTFDRVRCNPRGPIQAVWWHPRWIPFGSTPSGGNVCLDLAPAKGGRVGQVIVAWNDDDRCHAATSFTAWLSRFVDELEAGEYAWSDDYDAIVPIGDL